VNFSAAAFPGCMVVSAPVVRDQRGFFTKPFSHKEYSELPVDFHIKELFWSLSRPGTLRGMHFQMPPHSHWKLVWCALGDIVDVLLDLRIGSPTFMATTGFHLAGDSGRAILIPPGVAHGFYVPDSDSIVFYAVSSAYSREHDKGVLWCSIGYDWPASDPIVSERDNGLPPLDTFNTPFLFKANGDLSCGFRKKD